MLYFSVSCTQFNNHNIDIHISESQHNYKFMAHYDKIRTRSVEQYLDAKIGKNSNMSFVNTHIDGNLTLDDHTTFYIRKYPGYLEIKLDKKENSITSYHEVKDLGEGLKEVMK
jgi:hypothetical protein